MKVIGHRGAAGLALENTLPSIELAKLIGVNSIEIDIQLTLDGKLVVTHDSDLRRVSKTGKPMKISTHTFKQIKRVPLRDNSSNTPSLEQALEAIGEHHVFIEIKSNGCSKPLLKTLSKFPKANVTIASFKLGELAQLRELSPRLEIYALERTKPVEIIQTASALRLDGVGLNFWLLNPLTYWMCKKASLKMYVYTVNFKLIGKLIGALYPRVAICTDHPEYFVKHPYPIVESIHKAKRSKTKK